LSFKDSVSGKNSGKKGETVTMPEQERLGYAIVEPSVFGNSPVALAKAKKGRTIWTPSDFRGDLRGIKGLRSTNGVGLISMIRVIKGDKISDNPEVCAPDRYELAVFVNETTTRLILGSHLIFDTHEALTEVYEGITGFVGTHDFVVKNVPITETLWALEGVMNAPFPSVDFISREWIHADENTGTAVALVKWLEPCEKKVWAYVIVGTPTDFILSVPFTPGDDFDIDEVCEGDSGVTILCHGQVWVYGAQFWGKANGFKKGKNAFTPYPQKTED